MNGQPSHRRLVIDANSQTASLFENDVLFKLYKISTAVNGLGCESGSYCTPIGKLKIAKKIGAGTPLGGVFRDRKPTGEIWPEICGIQSQSSEDLVLSRILWLEGDEPCNLNTLDRYIYLHGTNQEKLIGTPASHGCIRFSNKDIIEIFDLLSEGDRVDVNLAALTNNQPGKSGLRHLLDHLDLRFETDRLILEPIKEEHAAAMVLLLGDADLHTFVPTEPPTLEKLKSQYKNWESRISPQGDELWLNWIGRLKLDGKIVGHFQAGVKESLEASVAYTIGIEFQRRGFAYEGLKRILEFLFDKIAVESVKAWIDTRNQASISLVKKLGMAQIDFVAKADHFKGSDSDEFVYGIERP